MSVTPTDVSNARLSVGTYTVNIGSHQWDFVDGEVFYGRRITGSYGVEFFQPYGPSSRTREVRFVKIQSLVEQLRELSYRAGLMATRVKFIPDVASPGTFWWVDWPEQLTFHTIVENRLELRVALLEQSPGA